MTEESVSGTETVYCPFCDKKTIAVVRTPGYKGSGTSRGSGITHRSDHWVSERLEILSGCSACGKSLKEVKKELD